MSTTTPDHGRHHGRHHDREDDQKHSRKKSSTRSHGEGRQVGADTIMFKVIIANFDFNIY